MPVAEKTASTDAAKDAAGKGAAKGGKKSKKKLVIIAVVVVVVLAAAYFMVLKPKTPANAAPQPGVVTQIDPITVNLAGGHYLRIGIALQFTKAAGAGGEGEGGPDTARALDETISALSGRSAAEFQKAGGIDATRKMLTDKIGKAYDGKVMEVLFTQFVIQ